MAGGHYIALSGMRTRLDELDRLAADLANVGTAGYKGERVGLRDAPRPQFDAALETAIDATTGGRRLDNRPGAIERTARDLDLVIEGRGFLVVDTPAGPRYTRNGHLTRQPDGTLVTADGAVVRGAEGPLTVGEGRLRIDADGTVTAGETVAGKLAVVEFADPGTLVRETGALLRAPDDAAPAPAANAVVRTGALEASNVSVVDRVAELTNVNRSFQALQKAVSVLMNDIDGRAVETLSRR